MINKVTNQTRILGNGHKRSVSTHSRAMNSNTMLRSSNFCHYEKKIMINLSLLIFGDALGVIHFVH